MCIPFCSFCLLAITPPPAGHHRVALSISAPVNKNHCAFHPSAMTIAISACAFQSVHSTHVHSTHQPSPSQSVLVHSSLCNPPTGNPPLQSVRVCPTSASAPTVHCVSELVLSSSTPVNENHFCSPHNRQPDRKQCL